MDENLLQDVVQAALKAGADAAEAVGAERQSLSITCRLGELVFGGPTPSNAPLTIGILELVSTQQLSVTAVYLVSNKVSGAIDMNVRQIKGTRGRN